MATAGMVTSSGITTNGSDFWVVDYGGKRVYHFDENGNNMSDGFSTGVFGQGANPPYGIATNGTDLWIAFYSSLRIVHCDLQGNNLSGGFDTDSADYPQYMTMDDTYTTNAENLEYLSTSYAQFSVLNGNLISRSNIREISEYKISIDSKMVWTGNRLDISPS